MKLQYVDAIPLMFFEGFLPLSCPLALNFPIHVFPFPVQAFSLPVQSSIFPVIRWLLFYVEMKKGLIKKKKWGLNMKQYLISSIRGPNLNIHIFL